MDARTSVTSPAKPANPARRRPRRIVGFFGGRVSAAMCGFVLLGIGAFWIAGAASNLRKGFSPDEIGGAIVGRLIGVLIMLLLTLHFGVACGRFLLRAAPPQLQGRPRLGILALTIPLLIICAIASALLLIMNRATSDTPQQPNGPLVFTVGFIVLHLTWWLAVAAPLFARYRKPQAFLDQRFVVFLRRFSKFSDRVVVNLILSQTPADNPVVFLTPTRSLAGDWNPFLVGFAGMKLWHPFRSIPVTLRSPDEQWEQAAELLIHHAQQIVFDISEGSGAIETEFELISQAGRWKHVICLKEHTAAVDPEFEQLIKSKGAQVIAYEKSWLRAIPRLVFGFVVLSLASVPLSLATSMIGDPTLRTMYGLLMQLFNLCLYFSFFVRPAVDRATKTALKTMLYG